MKRTLFILAVLSASLSGVASATDIIVDDYFNPHPNGYADAYTLNFTVFSDADFSKDTVLLAYWGNKPQDDLYLNAIVVNKDLTLHTGVGSLDKWPDDSPTSPLALNSCTFTLTSNDTSDRSSAFYSVVDGSQTGTLYTLEKGVAYTLKNIPPTNAGAHNQQLSLWKDVGGVSTMVAQTGTFKGNMNGATEKDHLYAKLNWAVVTTAAIPEPATATLSLLALAGLAARRRRK